MSNPLLRDLANLTGYLRTLDASVLHKLYQHPATSLAVFRELSEFAQLTVMRLLFVEQPVPSAVVRSWLTADKLLAQEAEEQLSQLCVWTQSTTQGGVPSWSLNDTFRNNLKMAMLGGGRPWTMSAHLDPDPNKRDEAFLDAYAQERWNTVLHYMVGSSQQEGISADAVRILLHAGLMLIAEGETTPSITQSGFQFLLMDTPSQVWYFILQYLDTVPSRQLDLAECLNLLFLISFSQLGKDYSTVGMSSHLLAFLQHLREFGLVYQRKRTAGRFYPTRLALNIASGEKKSLKEAAHEGYLFIETNYRIYAYTSNDLQVALVALFAEVLYRFPNLAVCLITRESIRQALRGGITGSQIVRFLRLHTHATCRNKDVPKTVVDQILLWEKERDRFSFVDGVLYNQFLSQGDFDVVRQHAESLGVCVWKNERTRTLVVTKEGHDSVKKFWRKHSKGQT